MIIPLLSHPALRRATLENFSELSKFLAHQQFEPTQNISDFVQDAALYAFEHQIPLQDALKRISKTCPYKTEIPIEIFADRKADETKFKTPRALCVTDEAKPEPDLDAGWLDMLYVRLEWLTRGAPTVVKRNYARRALLILDCLCELVETEQDQTGDIPSLVVSVLENGGITNAPRLKLRQYVLAYLKAHQEPISDDYLRHNWTYLAEIANGIIQRNCTPKAVAKSASGT